MTSKPVLPCEPIAAKLTPNHRTLKPANIARAQIATTFGNILATLFEANESSLLTEMGLLIPEQCIGVAIRCCTVKT